MAKPSGDHTPLGGFVFIPRGRRIFDARIPKNFFETMTNKLSLQEALKKLARSRHPVVKRDRNDLFRVKSAHRTDANKEFHAQPSAEMAWFVGTLAALTLIDWLAVRWL